MTSDEGARPAPSPHAVRAGGWHVAHHPLAVFAIAFGLARVVTLPGRPRGRDDLARLLGAGAGTASLLTAVAAGAGLLLTAAAVLAVVRRRDVWLLAALVGWTAGLTALAAVAAAAGDLRSAAGHGVFAVVFAVQLVAAHRYGVRSRSTAPAPREHIDSPGAADGGPRPFHDQAGSGRAPGDHAPDDHAPEGRASEGGTPGGRHGTAVRPAADGTPPLQWTLALPPAGPAGGDDPGGGDGPGGAAEGPVSPAPPHGPRRSGPAPRARSVRAQAPVRRGMGTRPAADHAEPAEPAAADATHRDLDAPPADATRRDIAVRSADTTHRDVDARPAGERGAPPEDDAAPRDTSASAATATHRDIDLRSADAESAPRPPDATRRDVPAPRAAAADAEPAGGDATRRGITTPGPDETDTERTRAGATDRGPEPATGDAPDQDTEPPPFAGTDQDTEPLPAATTDQDTEPPTAAAADRDADAPAGGAAGRFVGPAPADATLRDVPVRDRHGTAGPDEDGTG